MTQRICPWLFLVLLLPAAVEAQVRRPHEVEAGSMVRWRTRIGERGQGRLAESYDPGVGSLVVCSSFHECTRRASPSTRTVGIDDLASVEVRVHSGTGLGFAVGGAVGALVGLGLVGFANGMGAETGDHVNVFEGLILVLGGTAVFGSVGGFIGSSFATWRRVR